jgi:hypothetical protein
MGLRGHMKNGVVVLNEGPPPPEGTEVEVRPVVYPPGNPLAVIAAMESEPHLSPDDMAELERAIAAGRRPAAAIDPFGTASESD